MRHVTPILLWSLLTACSGTDGAGRIGADADRSPDVSGTDASPLGRGSSTDAADASDAADQTDETDATDGVDEADGADGTDGADAAEGGEPEVRFAEVYDQVLVGCAPCHAGFEVTADSLVLLVGDPDEVYDNLFRPSHDAGICGMSNVVVPGEPQASALYVRAHPVGSACPDTIDAMPPATAGVSAAQAMLLHDWIAAGAPR